MWNFIQTDVTAASLARLAGRTKTTFFFFFVTICLNGVSVPLKFYSNSIGKILSKLLLFLTVLLLFVNRVSS